MLDSIFLMLAPISARVLEWSSTKRDGNTIYQWLAKNTCNEPAESHKAIFEIQVSTRISEERIRAACRQDFRIFQALSQPGHYSLWRQEPQSVDKSAALELVRIFEDDEEKNSFPPQPQAQKAHSKTETSSPSMECRYDHLSDSRRAAPTVEGHRQPPR